MEGEVTRAEERRREGKRKEAIRLGSKKRRRREKRGDKERKGNKSTR